MRINSVLETCLYVDDLEQAEAFYCTLLGLVPHSRQAGRHLFLRCGEAMFLLFRAENTSTVLTKINGADIPLHGSSGPGHVAFAVEETALGAWREKLLAHGVGIESEVTWPNGGRSIYVRDPDGNSVELATPSIWR